MRARKYVTNTVISTLKSIYTVSIYTVSIIIRCARDTSHLPRGYLSFELSCCAVLRRDRPTQLPPSKLACVHGGAIVGR